MKSLKILGILFTVLGLIATVGSNVVSDKQMEALIDEKINAKMN